MNQRNEIYNFHFHLSFSSDGWNTRQDVVFGQEDAARGSLSIQLSSPAYKPFEKHYLSLDPDNHTTNPWFTEFWESKFNCSFSSYNHNQCSGKVDVGLPCWKISYAAVDFGMTWLDSIFMEKSGSQTFWVVICQITHNCLNNWWSIDFAISTVGKFAKYNYIESFLTVR